MFVERVVWKVALTLVQFNLIDVNLFRTLSENEKWFEIAGVRNNR